MSDIKVYENSTGETQAYIGYIKNLNTVSAIFRGTMPTNLDNWIANIEYK